MDVNSLNLSHLVSFFDRLPEYDHGLLRQLLGEDDYRSVEARVDVGRRQLSAPETDPDELLEHLQGSVRDLLSGGLVPFLGAGASTYARDPSVCLKDPRDFTGGKDVPTAAELARYLVSQMPRDRPFPDLARSNDLILVSQWLQLASGKGQVTRNLRQVFNRSREPTALHRFLAEVPALVRRFTAAQDMAPAYPIYFTTNYDDLLSQALIDAGEPFDVFTYISEGRGADNQDLAGKLRHNTYALDRNTAKIRRLTINDRRADPRHPDGSHNGEGQVDPERLILTLTPENRRRLDAPSVYFGVGREVAVPTHYRGPSLQERPIIIEVHGAVDRNQMLAVGSDSYVITEDDYLDFLPRTKIASLFPGELVAHLQRSSFLFLGYGLRDWNLRAIIRVFQEVNKLRSWAVQLAPDEIERFFWEKRNVTILNMPLGRYVPEFIGAARALAG